MNKLYKVVLGKPTGDGHCITFSYSPDDRKIKSEYYVIAKSFNEAGRKTLAFIDKVIKQEKSTVRVTEDGIEDMTKEINIVSITLFTDELIF